MQLIAIIGRTLWTEGDAEERCCTSVHVQLQQPSGPGIQRPRHTVQRAFAPSPAPLNLRPYGAIQICLLLLLLLLLHLNSTQINRELRTQVSDTSESASSLYTIINEQHLSSWLSTELGYGSHVFKRPKIIINVNNVDDKR